MKRLGILLGTAVTHLVMEVLPMPSPTILPYPDTLHLIRLAAEPEGITLTACAKGIAARCPLCAKPSERVHSRYVRTPTDLPWQGIPVRLRLHVRRFFCDDPSCERRIFTERLPGVVAHYGRRTERLEVWFTHVSFALGGEAGARLLGDLLGTTVSGDTLLKHIRSFRLDEEDGPPPPTPRVLSVDDFAFRKGRTYGTILVDLERHGVVDLLPDRSAKSFADWLERHPGVEVISRDRGGEYAEGAKRGAPDAIQVADRFHLIKNLKDVLLRVLKRHSKLLEERVPAPGSSQKTLMRRHPRPDREASRERTRIEMRDRFEAIHSLAQQGMSKAAIARALEVHRHTVQKYLALEVPPQRRHYTRKVSAMMPYEGYILERWRGGCRNATQIWREIVQQGYPGAYRNVARLTGHLRSQEKQRGGAGHPLADSLVLGGLTPSQAAGLLVIRPEKLTEEERLTLERLKGVHSEIHGSASLFEEFARMIRERKDGHDDKEARQQLGRWMVQTESCGIPELETFVVKLRQDFEAVLAALVTPYSQGQTEGRVNKLKLIKRSMYGRAKFDLLRRRVLYAAA
jgi:transposase